MNRHTPGPWSVTELEGKFSIWGANSVVAQTQTALPCIDARPGSPTEPETARANAQLIAAAPDLLREITYLANYFELHTMDTGRTIRGEQVWRNALAAIAKAEGKTA